MSSMQIFEGVKFKVTKVYDNLSILIWICIECLIKYQNDDNDE